MASDLDVRRMRLRYTGRCGCGEQVAAGTWAGWDPVVRRVVCPTCLAIRTGRSAPIRAGKAGGSARAEGERRRERREQSVRDAHPRLAGLILAVTDDPASTKAWLSGAEGEERVAARLDGLADDGVLLLHDRRIPRTRANIDHLAVGPAGIYVVDAKHYRDARIEVRRDGGFLRPARERLFVGGRDRTKLVAGLAPQVAAVREAIADMPGAADVAIRPVLCFVDGQLPLLGTQAIGDVALRGPKGTAKLLREIGPLSPADRALLHARLADRLPPAC